MTPLPDYVNSLILDFQDTSFNLLMQKRIHRILIICNSYDAFMLEEDGRIDEQIFNEYVSLNLRYPPTFIRAKSAKQAFEILEQDNIDLVISMLNISDSDTFDLAREIKSKYADKPIVVLTPFSREVMLKIDKEDLGAIDYVFCWLGNADLLLAIIKLIEDQMNAEYDVDVIGVQTIILVEDSIRFYSSYLPNIYKIILKQSEEYIQEALNEHQKMLRMRGRPKILLATTYNEAVRLYEKYQNNLLGIISDITYKEDPTSDHKIDAGFKLCKLVKEDDKHMPFLLQSSDLKNKKRAKELGVGFIHKYSKTLSLELRDFIVHHFAFGDFVFVNPEDGKEVCRAPNLQTLQNLITKIPDKVLQYHTSRNHLSKWLNARALFSIAQMFKYLRVEDFSSLDDVRKYVYQAISSYRFNKGRGIIAKYDRSSFDEYLIFSRIGDGSIGGKARGLAFINSMIKRYKLFNKFEDVVITIPRTVVISTDFFDKFMEKNDLYKVALSEISDDAILNAFLKAKLPSGLHEDLQAFLGVVKNPIAIRSSSKLEDSHYQPFAGIYSTYMIPNVSNKKTMMRMLTSAIKSVYASVYYKSSKSYMTATSNVIDEEKMGIVLQEVCGTKQNGHFHPTISGVARSINFYPLGPEKPEDGIAQIAYGLGKLIVDGGVGLRFSPKYPKKILQLSSPDIALRDSQKKFYTLNMSSEGFIPSTDDGVNILSKESDLISDDPSATHVLSTFDYNSHRLVEGTHAQGKKIVTFKSILSYKTFPLAEILQELLRVGEKEMGNPIEIEFAVNLNTPKGFPKIFNFLQIRPIVLNNQMVDINWDEMEDKPALIKSNAALGNGTYDNIDDFIYVKPGTFDPAKTKEIASKVEAFNDHMIKENRNYVLVGPGRWGSADPWLGIPVKWSQISQARLIVESGLKNFKVDPSQGTHFFQNLTSFNVGYFTINPYMNDGFYDVDFLDGMDAVYEDEFLRHVRFDKPMDIVIDGKQNKGIVIKP